MCPNRTRAIRWKRFRPSTCPFSAHTAQRSSATQRQLDQCDFHSAHTGSRLFTESGALIRGSWDTQPQREASASSSGVDGTQEALAVQYLASVGAAGDGIDEDRVAGALHTAARAPSGSNLGTLTFVWCEQDSSRSIICYTMSCCC